VHLIPPSNPPPRHSCTTAHTHTWGGDVNVRIAKREGGVEGMKGVEGKENPDRAEMLPVPYCLELLNPEPSF